MSVSTEDIYEAGRVLNDLRMDRNHVITALLFLLASSNGVSSTGTEGSTSTNTGTTVAGDATSANQASQIALETDIRDKVVSIETILNVIKTQMALPESNGVPRVDRGGTTSATPNTVTTVMAAKSLRRFWRVHNPLSNTSNIEVGYFNGSVNIFTASLLPGGTIEESVGSSDVSPQAIVIRSSEASIPYYAVEA